MFTTSKGTTVQFKEYLTARAMNEYKEVQYGGIKTQRDFNGDVKKEGQLSQEMDSSVIIRMEMKGLELTVLSVNDMPLDIEKLLDMEAKEYTEIVDEMNRLFFSTKK